MSLWFGDHLGSWLASRRVRPLKGAHGMASEALGSRNVRAEDHAADPLEEMIPDELVDALLDGEVDPDRLAAVRATVRRDEAAEARLASTWRMLDLLKETPAKAMDSSLTSRILASVDRERALLSRAGVRRTVRVRYAAAALVALLMGVGFVSERAAGPEMMLVSGPAPVNDVVRAVPVQTAEVLAGVEGVVRAAGNFVPPRLRDAGARELAALSCERDRLGGGDGCDLVPSMNPRIAAALWVDAPGASERGAATVDRACVGARHDARRGAGQPTQVSLRAILTSDEDAGGTSSETTLVAFRR